MYALPLKQLLAHVDNLVDPIVPDGCIVVLDWLNHVHDLFGHVQFGELDEIPERVVTLKRNG